MKADPRFLRQPPSFWAYVRALSEKLKYTEKKTKRIKIHSVEDISKALRALDLSDEEISGAVGQTSAFGNLLRDYFIHRADVLNRVVEPHLMKVEGAKTLYNKLRRDLRSELVVPMNKQKGPKKLLLTSRESSTC